MDDKAKSNQTHETVSLYPHYKILSNLNGSNTDDSLTMANSNSFLSPYEIHPIAQENKY